MPEITDEYRISFTVRKATVSGIEEDPNVYSHVFESLDQAKRWIEACRGQGIFLSVKGIEHARITREDWEPVGLAYLVSLKTATGEIGPHTQEILLKGMTL